MRYLIQFRREPSAPRLDNPLSANKAVAAYVTALQKKAILEVGYVFVTGGGMGILNVASHEELWEIIYAYPLYTSFQWQVDPLADVTITLGRAIEMIENEARK